MGIAVDAENLTTGSMDIESRQLEAYIEGSQDTKPALVL